MPAKKESTAKKAAKKATKKAAPKAAGKSTAKKAAKKTAAKAAAKPASEMESAQAPSHLQIAATAYLHYCHRLANGLPGDDLSDWLAAEAELSQ